MGVRRRKEGNQYYGGGQCGRMTLYTKYTIKPVEYWLKIIKMEPWRPPRQCFQMLCAINQNRERPNWATYVKSIPFQYGLSVVWLYNGQAISTFFSK